VSAPYPSPQRLAQAYRRTGREDLAQKELEAFEKLQPRSRRQLRRRRLHRIRHRGNPAIE